MSAPATILDMCWQPCVVLVHMQVHDERAIFSDIRKEKDTHYNGRRLIISLTLSQIFVHYHFTDIFSNGFVLDPPHLERVGDNARMGRNIDG